MRVPTNELLLALRSPTSGWLAAVVCALEEAVQDPNFTEQHRELVHRLLDAPSIPGAVSAAANDRLTRFEEAIGNMHQSLFNPLSETEFAAPATATRPKLTLVGSAAA